MSSSAANTTPAAALLVAAAGAVFEAPGLLPHANPGVLTEPALRGLREVCPSQGLMLESAATRLCEEGGPHDGSPDKQPQRRLDTIRLAGELRVPFPSGLLSGSRDTDYGGGGLGGTGGLVGVGR